MRIVLQHKESGLYFEDIDRWTPRSSEAYDFVSSTKAMEFCFQNKLEEVDIVLKFEREKYDIVMPAGWKNNAEECRAHAVL